MIACRQPLPIITANYMYIGIVHMYVYVYIVHVYMHIGSVG